MPAFDEFLDGYISEALYKVHDEDGNRANFVFTARQIDKDAFAQIGEVCTEFYLAHFDVLKHNISKENGISFYRARNRRGEAFITYGYEDYIRLSNGAKFHGRSKLILAHNGKLRLSP